MTKAVQNFNDAVACFNTGDYQSAACQNQRMGAEAMKCSRKALEAAGIDGDYCLVSKNDPNTPGGRREDCLPAMLKGCPQHFQEPGAAGSSNQGTSTFMDGLVIVKWVSLAVMGYIVWDFTRQP